MLCFYADRLRKNKCVAEEIASEAFIKIAKHQSRMESADGIKKYLFAIVRNDCYK